MYSTSGIVITSPRSSVSLDFVSMTPIGDLSFSSRGTAAVGRSFGCLWEGDKCTEHRRYNVRTDHLFAVFPY